MDVAYWTNNKGTLDEFRGFSEVEVENGTLFFSREDSPYEFEYAVAPGDWHDLVLVFEEDE